MIGDRRSRRIYPGMKRVSPQVLIAAVVTGFVSAATAFSVWHPSTHGIPMFGGQPHDHASAFEAIDLLARFGVAAAPSLVVVAGAAWIDRLNPPGTPRWSKSIPIAALLVLATMPFSLLWAVPALIAPVLGVIPACIAGFIAMQIARTPSSPPTSQP